MDAPHQTPSRCQQWQQLYAMRDRVFPDIGECRWRMLLTLHADGPAVVSSLTVMSGSPDATAIRHLGQLERDALIYRQPDPDDKRRVWIKLTDFGELMMMQATGDPGKGGHEA